MITSAFFVIFNATLVKHFLVAMFFLAIVMFSAYLLWLHVSYNISSIFGSLLNRFLTRYFPILDDKPNYRIRLTYILSAIIALPFVGISLSAIVILLFGLASIVQT
jgi:energy-converting hydrogenase Eha subunit A